MTFNIKENTSKKLHKVIDKPITRDYFLFNFKVGDKVKLNKKYIKAHNKELLNETLNVTEVILRDLGSNLTGEFLVGIFYTKEYPTTPFLIYHFNIIK